jgi:pyruvate formate lyase activating enzyme
MTTGIVFNIQRYSVHDGPGIRTTVFFKGCPLDCWWCHNPESQSARPDVMVNENRCIRCGQCREACPQELQGPCSRCGACVEACPSGARQMVGQTMSVQEVLSQVLKDRIFYDQSGGGVTFSGGEPLMQHQFLLEILDACKQHGLHTALDTSGHALREQVLAAAAKSDLVLYDLKVMDDAKHIEYTGVSNARILDNLRALAQCHPAIWLRVPILPGLNDAEGDLADAAEFAASLGKCVQRVSLLPYHAIGSQKFARLGRPNRMENIAPPTPQRLEQIAERFRQLGLDTHIGA